jgi:hypothetical protein
MTRGGKKEICKKMQHCCAQMDSLLNEERIPIYYVKMFREYRLAELELSERISNYHIVKNISHFGKIFKFCPWCGKKLPKSLFSEWAASLFKFNHKRYIRKNILELNYHSIPKEYKEDEWWINKKL